MIKNNQINIQKIIEKQTNTKQTENKQTQKLKYYDHVIIMRLSQYDHLNT